MREIMRYTGDPRFNFCEKKCHQLKSTTYNLWPPPLRNYFQHRPEAEAVPAKIVCISNWPSRRVWVTDSLFQMGKVGYIYRSESRSPGFGWDLEILACDWLKEGRYHLKTGVRIQTPRHRYVLLFPRLAMTAVRWHFLMMKIKKEKIFFYFIRVWETIVHISI